MHNTVVELSIEHILDSAIRESGQWFRGLRSTAENAESAALTDSASDDLLLTDDDKDAMKQHLKVFVSELYQSIRGYCPEYAIDEDADLIAFAIEGAEDCNIVPRVQPLMEFYFVYSILAWWYRYRNGDTANNYLLMADDYRKQVLSVIVPKFGTRKLRYF